MTEHERILELAVAALDFELPSRQRALVDAHLAMCPVCRRTVDEIRRDAERLRGLPAADAPDGVAQAVALAADGRPIATGRRFTLVLAMAATLIAVIAAGSLGVGAIRDRESSVVPPNSESPTATLPPSPRPTVSPTTSPDASPIGPAFAVSLPWQGVSVSGQEGRPARMHDVAATLAGFIAVGSDGAGRELVGAVWTSSDGTSWSEQLVSGAPGLIRVAVGPSVLVAISEDGIWTSTVQEGWQRAGQPQLGEVRLVDVVRHLVAGGEGYLAIATTRSPTGDAVVLTSGDGREWVRSPDTPALRGFCPTALADSADLIVAVGTDCDEAHPRAVIAVSDDGATWTRAPLASEFGDSSLPTAAVAGGPGFISGGFFQQEARTREAFWSSVDGRSWRRRGTFQPPGATEQIRDIAAIPDGLIAVGLRDPGSLDAPVAWTSPDGISWRRADPLPATGHEGSGLQLVEGVAGRAGRVVIVGWYEDGLDAAAFVWTAPLPAE